MASQLHVSAQKLVLVCAVFLLILAFVMSCGVSRNAVANFTSCKQCRKPDMVLVQTLVAKMSRDVKADSLKKLRVPGADFGADDLGTKDVFKLLAGLDLQVLEGRDGRGKYQVLEDLVQAIASAREDKSTQQPCGMCGAMPLVSDQMGEYPLGLGEEWFVRDDAGILLKDAEGHKKVFCKSLSHIPDGVLEAMEAKLHLHFLRHKPKIVLTNVLSGEGSCDGSSLVWDSFKVDVKLAHQSAGKKGFAASSSLCATAKMTLRELLGGQSTKGDEDEHAPSLGARLQRISAFKPLFLPRYGQVHTVGWGKEDKARDFLADPDALEDEVRDKVIAGKALQLVVVFAQAQREAAPRAAGAVASGRLLWHATAARAAGARHQRSSSSPGPAEKVTTL